MRAQRYTLIFFLSLTAASRLAVAQNVTIGASPHKNVSIAPISSSPPATSALSGSLAKLQPACFFLSNQDSRPIVAVLATWVTTNSTGRRQLHRHSTDSFQSTQSPPVLAPGSRILVAPGLWVPEAQITSLSGSSRLMGLKQFADIFAAAATVNAQVDSIIFSDGEIVGPDQQQFAAELTQRKQAATAVVQAVGNAKAGGKSPLDVLSKLRDQNSGAGAVGLTGGGTAVWTRRFADGLLHTPADAFDRRVADLAGMPVISVHRGQ